MTCRRCGAQLQKGARFCAKCGTKIESTGKGKRKLLIAGISISAIILAVVICYFTVHNWKDATCTEPQVCTVCGATRGSALGHHWDEATCILPQTCSICEITRGSALGHHWDDATCTLPQMCSTCGTTQGSALGHQWIDATYDAPKTCAHCGITDGDALAQAVTLTVWVPAEDALWLQEMQTSFEKAHPEYTITWDIKSSSKTDILNDLLYNAENGPDVYLFENYELGNLVAANALGSLGEADIKQIRESTPEAMINAFSTNGCVYGVPCAGDTFFMYYDKSVFSEEDVMSLDAMLEKGKVTIALKNSWFSAAFYYANGCSMFGPSANDATLGFDLGGSKAAAVTNYLIDLSKHPNFILADETSGLRGIQNGEIHAFFSGSWDRALVEEALGENYAVAKLPCITIGGQQKQLMGFANGEAIGVNPNADHLNAAYKLALFLSSDEGQKLRYELCGVVPCNFSLVDAVASNSTALVIMNCLQYSSTVQPTIHRMSIWWDTARDFVNDIWTGTINHDNAAEKTEAFNDVLNSYQ